MPEITQPFTDDSIMPFGKHKGKAMANIPARYLLWLHENATDLRGPVKGYIDANIDVIKREVEMSDKAKKQRSNAGK